ncbi:hypothetical protein [Streptomyces sp. TRM49041]|nr:hypothetical protein [Streptomyces sp. TRM49041]
MTTSVSPSAVRFTRRTVHRSTVPPAMTGAGIPRAALERLFPS